MYKNIIMLNKKILKILSNFSLPTKNYILLTDVSAKNDIFLDDSLYFLKLSFFIYRLLQEF